MGNAAVFADVAVFKLQLQFAIHHVLGLLRCGGLVVGVHQVQHAPTDRFLGCVAKDPLERRAHENDGAVGLDDAHRIEQKVHHVERRNAVHRARRAGAYRGRGKPIVNRL
ncbi:hypothetical protein D3C71_1651100 [compost metagenome]